MDHSKVQKVEALKINAKVNPPERGLLPNNPSIAAAQHIPKPLGA